MKPTWTVVLLLCLVKLGHCVEGKPCSSNEDCATDECCTLESQRRGKRQIWEITGTCMSFGTTNSDCMVTPYQVDSGVYEIFCPCSSGFTCQGTGQFTVPQGEQGICVSGPTPCNTSADCLFRKECCVSNVRPIGNRSVLGTSSGQCEPMGGKGDDCLEINGSGWKRNDLVFEHCPCQNSLRCIPDGRHDVPLGKAGTCQHGGYGLRSILRK